MALRTWLIRTVILAVLAGLGAAVWWAQSYVSPDAVKAAVADALGDQLADVDVHVGSARMQLFGGISVADLRISRKGDPVPFFVAPHAVIYHDKEQINSGRLAVRKIELDGCTVRVECGPDGVWTVAGLRKSGPADKPVPTFVVTNGTVSVTDRRPGGLPPVTLTGVRLTVLNDPLPIVTADGRAAVTIRPAGGDPVTVTTTVGVKVNRVTGEVKAAVEVADVNLTPALAGLAPQLAPAADVLKRLSGTLGVKADLGFPAAGPATHDVRVTLKDGKFADPALPWPVEKIALAARVKDGRVTVEKATAAAGSASLEVSLETRPGTLENPPDLVAAAEDRLEKLAVAVRDLPLSNDLFDRLGGKADALRAMLSPVGTVHISAGFGRGPGGTWKRSVEVRPAVFGMTYAKFRYPLTDVAGVVTYAVTQAGVPETVLDLSGSAAGQRVQVSGTITGAGDDPAVRLKVSGTNIPIDDALFDALPGAKSSAALRKLRASGRGDFTADVRQDAGVNLSTSVFHVTVTAAAMSHTQFPYRLDRVRGRVVISVTGTDTSRPVYPDRPGVPYVDNDKVELKDFEARHGPGVVTLFGTNENVPGSADRKLSLHVWGKDCPVDADLRAALAAIKIDAVWKTFSPRGAVTFGVDVDILDRAPPPPWKPRAGPAGVLVARGADALRPRPAAAFDPAADLAIALNFRGPAVTPDFFRYDLDDVAGKIVYDAAGVRLSDFSAAHGPSKWALKAGEVKFAPDGRVWANLDRIDVAPLVVDPPFLAALPGKLKDGVSQLNLRGPAELTLSRLVALTPPDPAPGAEAPDPDVYWAGEVRLAGAALDAGLAWEDVRGRVACGGRYHGTHLGEVTGGIAIDSARVATYPVTNVRAVVSARPQAPDPANPTAFLPPAVSFSDITGTLFRGVVGGEARVVLADPVRYRVYLSAADVKLEDVARHHNLGAGARLEGVAQAEIDLQSAADPAAGKTLVTGRGTADVDRGHMGNLKFFLPLLKVLKLQAPDKTMFTEAHATFAVRGDRVLVEHLDLLGDAVSLGGTGEVDTAGEYVKFDVYTIWSQTLQRWLTTPFGDVTAFVSEKLFKIEVTRRPDGSMQYDPRVVPFVTDPFRAVADRMKRKPR